MKRLIEKLKTLLLTPPPPEHRVAVKIEIGGVGGDPSIANSHSRLDIRREKQTNRWTAKHTGDYYVTDSLMTTGETPMQAILSWIEAGLQRCPGVVNWIRAINNIDKLILLSEPKVTIELVKVQIMKPYPHTDDCLTIWDEPHIVGRGDRGGPTTWSFTRYDEEDGEDIVVLRSEESSADHPWAGARTGIAFFHETFSSDEERALFYALAGWIRKSFQEAVERDASGAQKMAFLYGSADGARNIPALAEAIQREGFHSPAYDSYLNSSHWQQTKQRALAREYVSCEVCHSKTDLDLLHVTFDRIGRERTPDPTSLEPGVDTDVVVLCREHYERARRASCDSFTEIVGLMRACDAAYGDGDDRLFNKLVLKVTRIPGYETFWWGDHIKSPASDAIDT